MSQSANWKYCVVGNITKTHTDEQGILRYVTAAFTGGTRVYLCGRYWTAAQGTIAVIGITRGKKYAVIHTDPACIENVRCSRAFHPAVLDLMNDWEAHSLWWGNSEADRQETRVFADNWRTGFSPFRKP